MRAAQSQPSQAPSLAPTRSLTPAEKKRLEELHEVMKTGRFNTRSYLGNTLRKDAGASEEYKNLTSQREAADFRLKWATLQFERLSEKKVHTKSFSRRDTAKFTYRPFGRLVQDFGGWQNANAVAGATTAAVRCLSMGPPWAVKHPQTELVEYAVVEIEWQEEYQQSWQHITEQYATGVNAMVQPQATDDQNAQGDQQAKDEEEKKNDDDKEKAKASEKKQKVPETPEKKDFRGLISLAAKTKLSFQTVTSSANNLISQIYVDQAWAWARKNEHGEKRLQA